MWVGMPAIAAVPEAGKLGMEVILIDRDPNPGGVCLYRGCIPSKALLHVAKTIAEAADLAAAKRVENSLRQRLAARHRFAAGDERAVFLHNTFEEYTRYMTLFANIRTFIWLVGIGSIVAGIVGMVAAMEAAVADRGRFQADVGAAVFRRRGLAGLGPREQILHLAR